MLIDLVQQSAAAPRAAVPVGRAIEEYVGFLAWFGVYGAFGFRFGVLAPLERHLRRWTSGADERNALQSIHGSGLRGAANAGIIGSILFLVTLAIALAADATKKHLSAPAMLGHESTIFYAQLGLVVLLLALFLIGRFAAGPVWALAAIVGACLAFRNIVTGRWSTLVNPVHELSAALWLGTLFVLTSAGLPAVFRSDVPRHLRGGGAAELISRFSPLALVSASVLGLSGVTTAWLHLHVLSNLWTTPYGKVLIAKLCLVAIVLALGAWNWRRMTPALGQEQGQQQSGARPRRNCSSAPSCSR